MNKYLFKVIQDLLLFTSLSLAIVQASYADEKIRLSLEEPINESTYSGVSNIRGWAVAQSGIKQIELYVDGAFMTNIPSGGSRADVGESLPTYPDSDQSGFSMAFNYSNLSKGLHSILVRAHDNSGSVKEISATFTVTRFDNPFISNSSSINLNNANISHNNNSVFIKNLVVENKNYDIRLDWRTATQGFAITQISTSHENTTIFDNAVIIIELPLIPSKPL